jgi:hypothetical protein
VADENLSEVASEVTDALTEGRPEDLLDPGLAAKLIIPIAALGATWAVRQVLDKGFQVATGKEPPHAGDRDRSMTGVIMWAAATAAAVAIVNVVFDRVTAPKRHPQ